MRNITEAAITKQNKPAIATVVNLGVSFLHLKVTENIEKAVKDVKHGQARFKADQEGVIHGTFASVEMDKKQISENLDAFIDELKRLKPASSKGIYIKDIYLSTTMGPGYKIDASQY